MRLLTVSSLALLASCGYQAPLNPNAPEFSNVITGSVVASDIEQTQPVIVYLAAADNPMPPLGRGRPLNFTTVPGRTFTENTQGVREADYTITGVPDGSYYLTAMMDLDRNFHYAAGTLAGATCGDVTGAYLDSLVNRLPTPLTVSGGELYEGTTVVLGSVSTSERPAFTVREGADTVQAGGTPFSRVFSLDNVPIEAQYGEDISLSFSGPWNSADPKNCDTSMIFHVRDLDGDQQADPHPDYPPEFGLFDVWPRVYLQWLGEPIDTDGDNINDSFDRGDVEPGVEWVSEAVWLDSVFQGPAFTDNIGVPFRAPSGDFAFADIAQRVNLDGTADTIDDPTLIPGGAWAITVILDSGQTWTVPNELDTKLKSVVIPPPGVTSERDASQGTWLNILPAVAPANLTGGDTGN